MPMNQGRVSFETQPCTRCGGGGWFSYCQTWGRTCFKCGVKPGEQGLGRYLTKRGNAAYNYYVSLLPTRRALDLQPGDVLVDVSGYSRLTVESVKPTTSAVKRGDEWVSAGYVDVQCNKVGLCLVPEGEVYSVLPGEAERQECLTKALAYQEGLTKTGHVRKRIGKVAA